MAQPLQRDPYLQGLSRDHHQGLLFAFHLKKGMDQGISSDRILPYVRWFLKEHLLPHFQLEEKFLFPLLHKDHPLVKLAQEQHRALKSQLGDPHYDSLRQSAELLINHIRMEERQLFEDIQDQVEPGKLKKVHQSHQDLPGCFAWPDRFWQ